VHFERVTDELKKCLKRRLFTINYYSVKAELKVAFTIESWHT